MKGKDMNEKTNESALHGERPYRHSEQPCGAFSLAWVEYERRKSELQADLTPAEYTDAIRKICAYLNL